MTTPESPTDGAVSRTVGRDLADRMTALYADAERRLAADIARRLAAGMDRPDWAEQKLAALGDLRRFTRTLTQRLAAETEHEITQALLLGYVRGGTEAMRTITRLQNTLPEWLQRGGIDPGPRILEALAGKQSQLSAKLAEIGRAFPGVANVMRMVGSLALRIAGTHLPILRWAEDAYREVIATTAVPGVLLGLDTRRRASQIAWERLLTQGITGFKDKSGRNWNLASYVEMATRSGVAQASVEGHLDRLTDAGIDLVIVSNAPQECKRCRPWEGKILARSGPDGRRTIAVENVVTGDLETVEIWGTVDEAIRAGLLHPNCRHSLNGYLHGATKVPTNTQDPEGDAARQQLRALEREVRREKIKATATIDPHAADRHERRVRDLQAKIRDHVDATKHLGIFRKPERERVNLGNAPDPQRKAPPSPRVVKTAPPKAPPKKAAVPKVVKPKAPPKPKAPKPTAPSIGTLLPKADIGDVGKERIRQAVATTLDGDYAGFKVEVKSVTPGKNKLTLEAHILDASGDYVGRSTRIFHRSGGKLWAYHALLKLDKSVQGQGFAEAWNTRLMDWYIESGLDRIEVTANIDVGGYTWARQGFDFASKTAARTIMDRLARKLKSGSYDDGQNAAARDIITRMTALPFGHANFPTAYEVSQVGRQPGQGKTDSWIGKDAMLRSSWRGIKPVPSRGSLST